MSNSEYILRRNTLFEQTEEVKEQNERIRIGKSNFDGLPPDKQLKVLGFKSAPPRRVLTEAQDKANNATRHAESALQSKCVAWVKKWYPKHRIVLHKREGKRSKFHQNLQKKLNANADGYPDHEFPTVSMFIEFKRPGEGWLMADGKTVKKIYRHQYRMHLQLWSEGKTAYFCNDFDVFRAMYKCAAAGQHYVQQVYECPADVVKELKF